MIADFLIWLDLGILYVGSDGSVENGHGAHSFVVTSGLQRAVIWGGAATTPGNIEEMTSQRAEHAGSAAVFIILHVLQLTIKRSFTVIIWVDNVEVVRRGKRGTTDLAWRETLVLDYDLWNFTSHLQCTVNFNWSWEKVDSHITEKLKDDPTKELQGNPLAWRLNEAADKVAGVQRLWEEKPQFQEADQKHRQQRPVGNNRRSELCHGEIC